MVAAHQWWECTPVILGLGPEITNTDALGMSVLTRVWAQLSDGERHQFHQFCCEGRRDEATLATVRKMAEALSLDIEEDPP